MFTHTPAQTACPFTEIWQNLLVFICCSILKMWSYSFSFLIFQKGQFSTQFFFGLVSKLLVWVLSNSVSTNHVSWIIKVAKRETYWECKMWVIFKNDQLAQFSLTLVHLIWYKYKKEKTLVRLFCFQGNLC